MVILKKFFHSNGAAMIALLLFCVQPAIAQKKPLDYASLNTWPEISGEKISADGRFAIYSIGSRATGPKSEWFVKATDNSWQRQLKNASLLSIAANDRYVVYLREADSVVLYDPVKDVVEIVLPGNSYQLATNSNKLACLHRASKTVRLYDIARKKMQVFTSVENMELSADGTALVLVTDKTGGKSVKWIDLEENKESVVATGSRFSAFAFDAAAQQLAFIEDATSTTEPSFRIRFFKKGMDSAVVKVRPDAKGIDSGYVLQPLKPRFNSTGTKLFFTLSRKANTIEKDKAKADVTVWHYNDVYLPPEQSFQLSLAVSYMAVVQTGSDAVIQLTRQGNNSLVGNFFETNADHVVVSERYNFFAAGNNEANTPSHYLVNTTTGNRLLLVRQKENPPVLSPGGKFAVWYDAAKDGYYAYEIKTGRVAGITPSLKGLLRPLTPNGRLVGNAPYNMAGWLPDDSCLLVYDEFDIWKLDPRGIHRPVNITQGYGRRNKIVLRVWKDNKDYEPGLIDERAVLLTAFAITTKQNGFFKADLLKVKEPVLLTMDDCLYYAHGRFNNSFLRGHYMYKAAKTDMFLVRRSRADRYPELLATGDFKKFTALTNLQPEAGYNWMRSELIQYKLPNGKQTQAVLYKPTDFDSSKKYPLIIYIYEKLSYRLHQYLPAAPGDGSLNIPFFVSNGYLICTPDIEYAKGKTGESALEYVTAATNYLTKFPYVDAKKLGIQGHSFGGYQVNYIVAKSNVFAAAQPSAGASDFISYYNGNYRESSAQFYFESGQGRIGSTLWEKPELFRQNSPVFYANKVTTPVLIMHDKEDGEVPFQQGLEWFMALKRSGKKAWLIQYDKEYHGITQYKNQLDYTIRQKQFFDHYLKGTPQPVWMKEGLPVAVKNREDGLGY